MQDKTRIKHRYLQEFCKWHQRHLCAINMNCDTRRRNRVHFFGKAKIRRENTMKTTSEQDTGFCAECKTLRISQICSQNSATGFDTPCAKCTACAKCSELGVQIRGWCTFSRLRLAGEYCLRIRIRWRSMDWCNVFAGAHFRGYTGRASGRSQVDLCNSR